MPSPFAVAAVVGTIIGGLFLFSDSPKAPSTDLVPGGKPVPTPSFGNVGIDELPDDPPSKLRTNAKTLLAMSKDAASLRAFAGTLDAMGYTKVAAEFRRRASELEGSGQATLPGASVPLPSSPPPWWKGAWPPNPASLPTLTGAIPSARPDFWPAGAPWPPIAGASLPGAILPTGWDKILTSAPYATSSGWRGDESFDEMEDLAEDYEDAESSADYEDYEDDFSEFYDE